MSKYQLRITSKDQYDICTNALQQMEWFCASGYRFAGFDDVDFCTNSAYLLLGDKRFSEVFGVEPDVKEITVEEWQAIVLPVTSSIQTSGISHLKALMESEEESKQTIILTSETSHEIHQFISDHSHHNNFFKVESIGKMIKCVCPKCFESIVINH